MSLQNSPLVISLKFGYDDEISKLVFFTSDNSVNLFRSVIKEKLVSFEQISFRLFKRFSLIFNLFSLFELKSNATLLPIEFIDLLFLRFSGVLDFKQDFFEGIFGIGRIFFSLLILGDFISFINSLFFKDFL